MKSVILEWIRKRFSLALKSTPTNATASALSEMLDGKCCRCTQKLDNHSYQLFALTVATPERKETLLRFLQLARAHKWEELLRFQEFEGTQNALEVYALRCPNDELSVLIVRNPFELYESHSLELWEPLKEVEASKWDKHLKKEGWTAFTTKPVGHD